MLYVCLFYCIIYFMDYVTFEKKSTRNVFIGVSESLIFGGGALFICANMFEGKGSTSQNIGFGLISLVTGLDAYRRLRINEAEVAPPEGDYIDTTAVLVSERALTPQEIAEAYQPEPDVI